MAHVPKTYTMYALCDGEQIRYVGITGRDVKKRLSEHIKDKRISKKRNWLVCMKRSGKEVSVKILLTNLSREEAVSSEVETIALYLEKGFRLVNQTTGGDGVMEGRTHSQETKQKMSEERRGVKNSFYGHKHSEDTLRKLSSVLKGRNSWNKGKKLSAGHRKKLSDAHKGWAWQTGHTRFDLPRIRELYAQGEKQTQLAQMFNTDSGTISRIVNRVNYTYEKSL